MNILERILTRSSLDSDPDDVNQYETTNRILEVGTLITLVWAITIMVISLDSW